MASRIQWTEAARDDLRDVKAYVGRRNRVGLRRLVDELKSLLSQLSQHPGSGQELEVMDADHRYRQLVFAPYRLIYRIDDERVLIIRIWHGRRDPADLNLE